jgi:hypothetical protein
MVRVSPFLVQASTLCFSHSSLLHHFGFRANQHTSGDETGTRAGRRRARRDRIAPTVCAKKRKPHSPVTPTSRASCRMLLHKRKENLQTTISHVTVVTYQQRPDTRIQRPKRAAATATGSNVTREREKTARGGLRRDGDDDGRRQPGLSS